MNTSCFECRTDGVFSKGFLVSMTPNLCKIFFVDFSVMQLLECIKLFFPTLLHDCKTHNIKTLESMRAMWRIAIDLDIILLTVLKKIGAVMGAVSVQEQDACFLSIVGLRIRLRVEVLLDPIQGKATVGPAILANTDSSKCKTT